MSSGPSLAHEEIEMHLLTIVQKRPKYNLLMIMIKILFSLVSVRALLLCDLDS